METVLKAIREYDISVLFIEHDMEIVEKFAKRVIAFYNGEIIADGNPKFVLSQKTVKKYIVGGN